MGDERTWDYLDANRERWNELTPIHARSAYYGVDAFKAGASTLRSIERAEVGDVAGKSLLHLQCHFGLDTLSWARLGATVTGVDFSEEAIALARALSAETGVPATFVRSDIYALPEALTGAFDTVFTSYGVLCWLPDLPAWARVIAHFLKPGGVFYIVDGHPFADVFYNEADATELRVAYSYFHAPEPMKWEAAGSYADHDAVVTRPSYEWTHSLGDIVDALTGAGLRIVFLHEFPVCSWARFPFMEEGADGWWRLPAGLPALPLTFSLRAERPAP
ncbi:MAG TPA: class I SAM-dependent methyltransferase [Thermomicrobiales bacterium]|nr:class I SAM-dependent methyltransferase [Thermomicrobiales bacterium]